MSEKPPANPLFDQAPGLSDGTNTNARDLYGLPRDDVERDQLYQLQKRLKAGMGNNDTVFLPHLLVRSYVGDRGVRPYAGTFWESPDILLAAGGPNGNPDVPSTLMRNAVLGKPHTLYAHVWNLGVAPTVGVTVEFLIFDPVMDFALLLGGSDKRVPLFRATTRVDLAGRTTPGEAHRLVKCPKAWVPKYPGLGHQCVVVRVSGVGDTLQPAHQYEPGRDRHVAQRNLHFGVFGENVQPLINQLTSTLPKGAALQYRLAGKEAQPTVDLLAPGLMVDPQIKPHLIKGVEAAPKPAAGQVTVVRIEGAAPNSPDVSGGYTLLLTAQPLSM
ncbi:hypothetical protein [Streptomyces sp. NPDC001348]